MFAPFTRLPLKLPVVQKRTYDANDPNPCRGCSDCCEYISVALDTPRACRDFDEMFWFLLHQHVWIYIDEPNDWYVQFNTPCAELREQRCGFYANRPRICKEYAVDECTTYGEGDPHKHLFTSPDDLFQYLRVHRPKTLRRLEKYYADAGLKGPFAAPPGAPIESATAMCKTVTPTSGKTATSACSSPARPESRRGLRRAAPRKTRSGRRLTDKRTAAAADECAA